MTAGTLTRCTAAERAVHAGGQELAPPWVKITTVGQAGALTLLGAESCGTFLDFLKAAFTPEMLWNSARQPS